MSRFRRLRKTEVLRSLIQETSLDKNDLIQPFFVIEGKNKKDPIASMPGMHRYSIDLLLKEIERYQKIDGQAGIFFGIPDKKDLRGNQAYAGDGVMQKAVRAIKKEFPEFLVITDVCLCAYTSHGHCGVIENQEIHNDKTIELLGNVAVSHAEAGADIVAPSDMMDFRVKQIRADLDKQNFKDTAMMSYAVKYASAFYGPFRDAAHSTPQFGDRKTYQMDCANQREALREARQDVVEGADFIMVKPALAYLDIISLLRRKLATPIVAYSVSGEYAMIKAASGRGWINERDTVLESFISIKRAGADIIISYYAKDVLAWMRQ